MNSWRRQKSSDNYYPEGARRRPQNRKPPLGNWQPSVPAWEKKFCWVVGSVPWRKLLETKKLIHTYDNILNWDDSAGEEAFHNAKNRFWAEINGLPCEIPLPDSNAHIDDVDWNSEIDPELVLDLDRDYVVPDESKKGERVLLFGEPYAESRGLSNDGWGDINLENSQNQNWAQGNGYECAHDHGGKWDDDPWDNKVNEVRNDGGENGWGADDSGWKQWENKINKFDNHRDWNNGGAYGYNNSYGENNGRFMSRYKTTRFHGDEYSNQWERRNGNGRRRDNFVHNQQRFGDRRSVSREWNAMNSYRVK